ncbi:MAG TPA: hypothetical protein VMD59_12135 [Acidimicrobiales bacterium]|nr:hypothetical protein [Acidimicrobiales bacterium]
MFREADGELVVETDGLELRFDAGGGALRRVRNRRTGQVLTDGGAEAWRLLPQGTSWGPLDRASPAWWRRDRIVPRGFAYRPVGDALVLSWTTSDAGVRVEVTVRAGRDATVELWPKVEVDEAAVPPLVLTYPIVGAPRALSESGATDYLLFPAHTGILVRSPLSAAALDGCYPDGYSGCSVQLTAYYEERRGGFYLATHDPHSTWKSFRFSAEEWSVAHEAWDLRAGASMELDYPVVLSAMSIGDWNEAADIYRLWALESAPWCTSLSDSGSRAERGTVDRDRCRWLFEEVGLTIWGTPSTLDWAAWYQFYADVARTPLHIASGWDWPATRPNTLGKEGWLPPRFHRANLESWNGHYVTPYMNDLFISLAAEDFLGRWEPTLLYPYVNFTWSRFTERTMLDAPTLVALDPRVTTNVDYFPCPASETAQALHAWRDAGLLESPQVSGVCYDISSGNPMLWSRCWRAEHGHAPGRGREIIEAYDEQNRRSKREAHLRTGRYLVQGVETIIENIIDSVDFYVARAGAGPLGVLESWLPEPEAPPGQGREIVPLFDAVYHEVGPVREDGWLTLAADIGSLFYWAAARIVLQWGALLSLHYANNPPEQLPASYPQQPAEIIDWDGSRVRFADLPELDPAKAAFVGELARARTGFANAYLSYGRLLRPVPPVPVATLELDFRRRVHSAPRLDSSGVWEVPGVVHGAWLSPSGDVGLLYVNLSDEPVTAKLQRGVANLWPCDPSGWQVSVSAAGRSAPAGAVGPDGELTLELTLPPREVVLVEIARSSRPEQAP